MYVDAIGVYQNLFYMYYAYLEWQHLFGHNTKRKYIL